MASAALQGLHIFHLPSDPLAAWFFKNEMATEELAAIERAAAEEVASEKAANERAANERAAFERAAAEEAAFQKAAVKAAKGKTAKRDVAQLRIAHKKVQKTQAVKGRAAQKNPDRIATGSASKSSPGSTLSAAAVAHQPAFIILNRCTAAVPAEHILCNRDHCIRPLFRQSMYCSVPREGPLDLHRTLLLLEQVDHILDFDLV